MNLPYELRIGMRYAIAGRRDRFVSFVSVMSALGIALGVAALVVVLSVMGGFHKELRARILSVASHLEAYAKDKEGFADWQEAGAAYLSHPDVLAAAPNIQEQGLLVNGEQVVGAQIRGVQPEREKEVSKIAEFIREGELSALTPGAYNVILGASLARNLRAKVGDELMLVAPRGQLGVTGFYPRMRRLQVAGIFSSGLYQFDQGLAYMDLGDVQTIYRKAGPTSVRLKLKDLMEAPRLAGELRAVRDDAYLYDWTTSHGGLFRVLVLEKRVMFVILTLIIAVAAFNIVSALVTMVRNKRGDIAILRAMGATGGGIARIFLFQGLFIGITGTALGIAAGYPLAKNAGDILNWVEELSGRTLFPVAVYHLDRLPSIFSADEAALVVGVAVLLSLLATVYPAWHAGRMRPADALRHEE